MKPSRVISIAAGLCAIMVVVPTSFSTAQIKSNKTPSNSKVLRVGQYDRNNQVFQVQKKVKPRFDLRRLEEQTRILKGIEEGRSVNKRILLERQKAERLKEARTAIQERPLKKAEMLGHTTRFVQAPRLARTLMPNSINSVSSANFLINGKTQDTVFVGDAITATFSFAPNAVSAVASIYLDTDGDGSVGIEDIELIEMLLLDNDDNDGNFATGQYQLRLTNEDFLTHFVGSFVVTLNDYQSISTATVVVRQKPTTSIVLGTTSPPMPGLLWYLSGISGGMYVFSDSAGRFSFYVDRQQMGTMTLRQPYDLVGVLNGYIPPASKTIALTADTTNVELVFSPAATFVDGYVLDQTGAAVIDAVVFADGSSFYTRTHTDSSGYYKVGVSPGYCYLSAQALWTTEYLTTNSSQRSIDVPSNATVQQNLQLIHANSTISGKVMLGSQGVGGIPISAYSDSLYNNVLTSVAGAYSMPVYSSPTATLKYTVSAYVSNGLYIPLPERSNIQPGAVNVDFAISRVAGGIQGRITDLRTGLPIANASIYASGTNYKSTVSNDTGYYKMSLLDGVYSLTVDATQYYEYYESNITVAGSMITRNVTLKKSGSISGVTKDIDGNPVQYASLYASDTAGYNYAYGYTNADGKYLIYGLQTSKYKVQCSKQGYVATWYNNVTDWQKATSIQVNEGFDTPNIDFVLSRGGSISGRVTDKSGHPIGSVEVDVVDTVYNYRSYAITDDSGHYTASGLVTGNYYVETYSPFYISQWYDGADSPMQAKKVSVVINQNTPNINFVLAKGGSISGKVMTKQHVPISNASIYVMDSTFSEIAYGYASDAGSYSVNRLRPGRKLFAYASAYGFASRWYNNVASPDSATAIVLQDGEVKSDVDFVLPLSGGISGRIGNSLGSPIPYAYVYALDKQGNYVGYGYADYQGTYQITNLSGGSYFATANSYGYEQQWFDHKASFLQADQITVVEEQMKPNINFDLYAPGAAVSQKFLAFITRVENAPQENRTAIVDSFMAAIPSVPFVEQDTIAYFFYRGNASSVTVPGDANEWDIYSYSMTPLSTTNLWYYCAILPPDARLEYKFYADGVWLLDPLNSKQWNGPYGPNSELRMPKYVPPAETEYDASIPHGTFQDTTFYSAILGNSRTVRVYIPPGYSSTANDTFAVVVFHDGQDYITQGSANNVLDYLTAQKLIRPTIGIFVPPVIRDSEYVGNLQDQYAAFIATELMPWVDSHYRTSKNPLNRATVGISNGGNISLWICYKYPESFGNAGSFSGNILSTTNTAYATSQKMPTRLYVDVGMYESYIRSVSSAFVQVIAGRGYTRRYREWHEGHSWGNWRAHLDNALRFFDNPALSVEQRPGLPPTSYQLLQNYPNPFNPSTTISFDVPKASYVTLRVFNLLGQEVATVVSENLQPGAYRYRFDAGRLASGVYIYRLNAGGYVQTKKMTLMK